MRPFEIPKYLVQHKDRMIGTSVPKDKQTNSKKTKRNR